MVFWGLILEPHRRYTQTVKRPFCITMASMDESTSDQKSTQVILSYDNRNYLLCTLKKTEIINVPLNLKFKAGDKISFASNGSSHVHLTGYLDLSYLDDSQLKTEDELETDEELEITAKKRNRSATNEDLLPQKKSKTLELLENIKTDDSDEDSDVNLSDLDLEEASSDDNEEEGADEEEVDVLDEEDDDDEEEENNEELEDEEEMQETQPKKSKVNRVTTNKEKQEKNQKKKQQPEKLQTPRKDQEEKAPKSLKEGTTSPQKKTVEGGVVIEDLKEGNGLVAKLGKIISVYYEGRLKQNNKVFDSTLKGKGFQFRLGRQEVIKGWDVGFAGMKVGGKRRITCPPNMAYGKKGSPPVIPPGSTLVFDVELLKVQ